MIRIGFIGFGEVATAFSREMQQKGAEIFYHDIANKDDVTGATLVSLNDLAQQCEIVLSTTTTHVAVAVAEAAAPFLTERNTYADLNSTSAAVKRRIAQNVGQSKAGFVEGAILSAVGEAGAKASILVAGESAKAFAQQMNQLGLVNLKYFSATVGEASEVKMLRSIFSKGVECLLLEMLVAGRRAGVAEYLWNEVVGFMTAHSFESVAQNWIKTHPLACERRYHEMVQVLDTLKELELEPLMSRGTTEFFKRSVDAGLRRHFARKPDDFWQVPEQLDLAIQ